MKFLSTMQVAAAAYSRSLRSDDCAAIRRTSRWKPMNARLVIACLHRIVRYFGRRGGIKWPRHLDDPALRDIGLARSQIKAAVHGFMAASELGEDMIVVPSTALNAAVGPRSRRRALHAELIPWS